MLPLTSWQLYARELPDELALFPKSFTFSLPGAKALEDFSDLLGETETMPEEAKTEEESAPFALPAMLPCSLEGPASLRREIDFGALHGDRAVLMIDHIIGCGRILLGEKTLCAFDSAHFTDEAMISARTLCAQPCMLAVDLSDALELGRRETISIEFDDSRPAGLPGPVMLHVTCGAHMTQLSLIPDAKQQTISVSSLITCAKDGRYILRVQGFLPDGTPITARETPLALSKGEIRPVQFSFSLPAAAFVSTVSHDMHAVKVQLFARRENVRSDGMLCDSATLMCGYAAKMPDAWLPLERAAAFAEPKRVVDELKALHIPAVSLDVPAPDGLYRTLSRSGIAVRQYMPKDHPMREALSRFPNVFLSDVPVPDPSISLEASAWQLCSMVSAPRTLDEALTPKELLREASGLPLDPRDTGVHDALLWLRALSIRLHAEAARQKRYHGTLCAANEPAQPDVAAALTTAFAPLHLSVLPLCGAWWTGTRFSATLEAFIPAGSYEDNLHAQAVLKMAKDANSPDLTYHAALQAAIWV